MRGAALALAGLCLAAPACADGSAPAPQMVPPVAEGYLSPPELEALAASVPPPPAEGSDEARADVAASERLRALEDSDRWLLATRHAELRPALALSHFDCALGFRLTAAESPRLVALLTRVLHDADEAAELAKARMPRSRPVAVDSGRRACQVLSEAGRTSNAYPSGSASVGAAYGAVMAVLAPDRAEAVDRIGHEIAVSRMVCGVHYPSDVVAGEALGRQLFDALTGSSAFIIEAAAARVEVEAARAAGQTSPSCAAERAALATPLP